MSIKREQTAARCVEIAKGLATLPAEQGVFSGADLSLTRELGIVARTAAILRGQQIIAAPALRHVAAEVGATWPELTGVFLPLAEELGWLEIEGERRRIDRVREHVPAVDELLRTTGGEWDDGSPTDYDKASVAGLHLLVDRPYGVEAFNSELDVSPQVASDVLDYGIAGTYMDKARDAIYSPLFLSSQAEKVEAFVAKHGDGDFAEVARTHRMLRGYPGCPSNKLDVDPALLDASVLAGFTTGVRIRTEQKSFGYYFAPHAEFAGDPGTDLFEKARVIVGALRHGQHNADVSRIHYPGSLLARFVDGSIGAHSHAVYQYAPLRVHGIADIVPVDVGGQTRYKPRFIDTEENQKAAELAKLMMSGASAGVNEIADAELSLLFGPGLIAGSARERRERRQRRVAANDQMVQLIRELREVRY